MFEKNSPVWYYSVLLFPLLYNYCLNINQYKIIPLLILVGVPLCDILMGDEEHTGQVEDLDKDLIKDLNKDIRYRFITWIWCICQLFIVGKGLSLSTTVNYIDLVWLILNCGLLTGSIGINVSHELIHRYHWFEQTCGKLLLFSVNYPWFYTEHLQVHHKKVGTLEDPATAKRDQSIYSFVLQSIIKSFVSAWNVEMKHNINNFMTRSLAILCCMYIAIYKFFGTQGVIFFLGQSLVAIILLEMVNYIEHYGLTRDSNTKVSIMHSWNTNTRLSNYLSFRLQQHSDHHTFPGKRYQSLLSFKESPQLPTGYLGSLWLAVVPQWWYRIMNRKLDKINTY